MEFQGQTRRPLKNNEVRRAVEKAYATVLAPSANFIPKESRPKWQPSKTNPKFRQELRQVSAVDLWEASPERMDGGVTQRMILERLFPAPDGLICVGKSAFNFHTATLSGFGDITGCQFIVPCYMTKRKGTTQDGKESMHCLDNCGPRRFCVCDFDEPKSADHPSIIWHLRKMFDLVMVLSSGGKSLHAWFHVPPEEEEEFWKAAVPLGADPVLMRNRSSFVRLPLGTRDTEARQEVLYLDLSKIDGIDCLTSATSNAK